jgi:polar amino acid transport system substrate-binding protein
VDAGKRQVSRSTWRARDRAACWAASLLLCGLLLCACQERDPSLERVRRAGVLRVGIDPSWPPFESVDPASGEIVGLDVDLARAIGQKLGVEVAFVPSGWEGLYGALFAGQFDAVISALPYDPWRTQEALYSTSYFNAGPVIVVRADQENEVTRARDLAGRTLHVEFGSEGDVQARQLRKKVGDLTVAAHDTAEEALAAVAQDPESAAIVDAVSARLYIRAEDRLQVVGEPLYDELYVVAVPPHARLLQKAIDQALIDMRESGELNALLERWL